MLEFNNTSAKLALGNINKSNELLISIKIMSNNSIINGTHMFLKKEQIQEMIEHLQKQIKE